MTKIFIAWLLAMLVTSALAVPVSVETGKQLAGRKFNPTGLYAIWTGLENTVPARATVDFRKQLVLAWALKCRRNTCTDVARQASNTIPFRYPAKPTRMTMVEYLRFIDKEVGQAFVDTNWELVRQEYRLTPEEGRILRQMMRFISARELVAYSLTELMPSVNDGELNVEVLRFLLRYAGREYVELLPAVNDKYTSFGPYQFTHYALFDNGEETRGASRANQTLRRGKIGGSVLKLKGPNHHRAAWLFALDNLAGIVKNSNKRELVALGVLATKPAELVKVVACAHHAPAPCRRVASAWVTSGAKGRFQMPGRVNVYVRKTEQNYDALL